MILALRLARSFATIHTRFCVVGGGSGGLNLTAHLVKDLKLNDQVRMFEPSSTHYYQSAYTQIGGDIDKSNTVSRPNKDIVPKGVHWTQAAVKKINADKNEIIVDGDDTYTYDYLILTSGVTYKWNSIKGAQEALQDPSIPVCSVYKLDYAEKTRRLGKEFRGGKVIFTEPKHPLPCSSSPQQIMYLLADRWKSKKTNVELDYRTCNTNLFKVPIYNEELLKIANGYGARIHYQNELVEVRGKERIAVFRKSDGQLSEEKFDFLHLVAPCEAHSYIAESGLADSNGYCDVDQHFLNHKKYNNIWAIGDCANLPCSKTSASLYTQTDCLIKNFRTLSSGATPNVSYDGYSCCPIFVGGKKAILAEYKYKDVPDMTFVRSQQKPSRLAYILVREFFPVAYWRFVRKGMWLGKDGIRS